MKLTITSFLLLLAAISLTHNTSFAQLSTYGYTGAVQYYTVPAGVTSVRIDANGAGGGSGDGGPGGDGACMSGTFDVTPGEILTVIVGGQGLQWGNSGGGGGGSGVLTSGGTPLIIGGAGGGGAVNSAGYDGVITEAGVNSSGLGGVGGNGGQKGYKLNDCGWASGGGGFTGDGFGGNGLWDGGALPGTIAGPGAGDSWASGGAGGLNGGCTWTYPNSGGWGCGAGGSGSYGGAGGGGYSGGGGGQYVDISLANRGGGGGGSYNDGTDQLNTAGCNSGHGEVLIEVLCNSMTVVVSAEEVCEGEEVTLDATSPSGAAVTWDGGVTDGVAFTPPLGTTTYTAVSADPEDCELTVDIVVNPLPTVTLTVDLTEICDGETVIFTAGGDADTYVWDPADVVSGAPYAPAGIGTATYTLVGTIDATGCSVTETIDVTVNPLPVVTASVDFTEICLGESVTFTGGGADTYVWDMGVTDGVAFTPAGLGLVTYTVTGTDAAGCENTASVNVTVNDSPVVTATADATDVCDGETVTLTGGGAATYVWDLGVTNGVAFVPPLGTTTYTVIGTTVSGCENTASIDITVNPLPIVTAAADDILLCEGEDVVLSGGGADTYVWDLGVTDGVAFTPPVGVTTYTVIGTVTASGCQGTASIDITVESTPDVTASASETSICEGESIILTGGGADTYVWDGGAVNGVAFVPAGAGTIDFTVTGTNASSGCENTATVTVTINPNPLVVASATTTEVCFGEAVTLSGSGASSYSWDGGIVNGVPFTPGAIATTTYTVTGTSAFGCVGTATITINVIDCEPVVPYFNVQSTACVGDCITITDESTGAVAAWAWNFGGAATPGTSTEQNPVICLTSAGSYTIELTTTSSTGAISTVSHGINVFDNPIVVAAQDTIIDLGGAATLVGATFSTGTFEWEPTKNMDCSDCQITSVSPAESTTYTVYFEDQNGCTTSDTVMVLVNFIEGVGVPTAFSPNGDGYNDILFIKGYALESVSLVVYNRYGEVVFETTDQRIGWDGTFKNREENPGVFMWVLNYQFLNGKSGTQKGNTTLIR